MEYSHKNRMYTGQDIINMRIWLQQFRGINADTVNDMPANSVLTRIDAYYWGGCAQFNADQYRLNVAPFMYSNMVISASILNGFVKIFYLETMCAKIVKPDVWERYKASLIRRGVLFDES